MDVYILELSLVKHNNKELLPTENAIKVYVLIA